MQIQFSKLHTIGFMFVIPLIFSVGCGGSESADQPNLGTVTGMVTMDGQPLTEVVVTFNPTQGRPSIGKTDSTGKYELGYVGDAKGATIGTHKVSISTPQDAPTPPGKTYKDPVPSKYNSKTTLNEEVKAGENTINFELVSK